MSFFSLVVAHWYGSHKRERSCYSSYFILPSITELHLMRLFSFQGSTLGHYAPLTSPKTIGLASSP